MVSLYMTINNFDENIDDSLATLDNIVKINVDAVFTASLRSARRRRHLSHYIIQPRQSLGKASTILRQTKRPSDRKYYTSNV